MIGGRSLGVVCLGPDVTILSFDSAVHGCLNARCSTFSLVYLSVSVANNRLQERFQQVSFGGVLTNTSDISFLV